jgi:probable rRNA maturation factor
MRSDFPLDLALLIEDERWSDEANLLALAETALKTAYEMVEDELPQDTQLSLVFTNDAQIKTLNSDWREKDKATNVLSFPALSDEDWDNLAQLPEVLLGDIILAFETIEREAIEADKTFNDHLSHLIIHGFLHLLGFDHIEDTMAEEMEGLEIKILAKLNIDNPYDAL